MTRIEKLLLAVFPLLAVANLSLQSAGGVRLVAGHLALIIAPAIAAAACFHAARHGTRRASASWWLIGAGAFVVMVGQALWFVQQVAFQQVIPFPSLSFYLFLSFHPLFAIGVLRSLRPRGRSESQVDFVLDALLAVATIATFMIRFLHEPLRSARPWLSYVEVSWIVGGQFMVVVSLIAVGILVIWRRSMLSPRAMAGLTAVAVANVLANLLQMASIDPDPGSPGDAFDLVWLVGWALLTWAAFAGAATGERVWSGRAAAWLSGRLRQSIAPVAAVVMTLVAVDIAVRGRAGIEVVVLLFLLGLLLAARMVRGVGATERESRERRELERTRILVELSRAFAAAPRVEDALTHVLTAAERLLTARRVWIERIGDDGSVRVHTRDSAADTIPAHGTAGRWLAARRFAQKLTGEHERTTGPGGESLAPRLWLAAGTIRFGHRTAGTLVAVRDDAGLEADELEMLGALADQAAIAIENARLLDEARQAERDRLSNEKLVSLGNLVAGVAHEINNPLTAIQSAADLLAAELPQDCGTETLGLLRLEATRAAGIVRRMLDFVSPAEVRATPIDLAAVIHAALKARRSEHARAGIRVNLDLPNLPPVLADDGRLHQVFLNLILNAEHATVGNSGERRLDVAAYVDDTTVRVDVRDNGCGIPDEHLDRVFDPFFTTKAPGAGTGLGLSLSHGIVREFGGALTVESAAGAGTTFSVRLGIGQPAGQPETAPPTAAERSPPVVSPLSILLVEDEASIRTLVSRYLRRRGHDVETAINGRDALAALEHRSYDVVVTDMKMPDVGGEELYRKLCDVDIEQARRVLFISGDTVAEGTRDFLMRSGRRFVSKPFDVAVLADSISEVAASAEAAATRHTPDAT